MPNEGMKISQLPAASEVLDSDVLAGVGGGVTRKFTFATIASYIQTKLTALFDAKQNKITANGVLQGDGDGGVTAKTLDTSSLTNDNDHIPTSGVVKSALDAVGGLNQSLEIASGTDLNDLTTPGAYNCVNSTIASTLANCPVSAIGFSLLVAKMGNSASEQLIIADTKLFSRVKNSGGWTNWTVHAETTYLGNVFRSAKYASSPNGTLTIDLAQRTKRSLTGFLVLIRYVAPYTVSLYYVVASDSYQSRYVTISDPSNYNPTIVYDSTANTLTVNFASGLTSMQADIYYDS